MTEIKIRKAILEDIPEIVKLAKEMWDFHDQFPTEFLEVRENALEIFEKWCKDKITEKGFVLVAENENKLIGYLLAYEHKNSAIYKDNIAGHIYDLYVKEEFRGKGTGKKLMQEAEKILKNNYKHCSLEAAFENKKSIEFYKSLGFMPDRVKMVKKI